MKELLIHIGYPKTATTTLQEGVFLKLHNEGLINFLGRTQKSTHTRFGRSHFNGHDWVVDIRREFLFGERIRERAFKLKSGMLNVLSDEDLTIHPDFHKAQFGISRNPLELAGRLKQLSADADKVTVLLTLRNQGDLIPSCYLQKFRFLYSGSAYKNFETFLLDENSLFKESIHNTFCFPYVINHYKKYFNGSYKFLFFEDLKSDKTSFITTLSDVLGIGVDQIEPLIEQAHYRNRAVKSSGKQFTSIFKPFFVGRLMEAVMGKERFTFFMNRFWYMRYSVFRKYARKFLVKDVHLQNPEIGEQYISMIRGHFSESNAILAKDYMLDCEKMKRYGYFN